MIIHADSNGAKCVVYVKFRVRFFLSQAHALIACLVCVGEYNSTRLALKQETFKEFEEVLAFVLADNSVGHYCLIVSTAIPFVIFAILRVFISALREIRGWPFLFHQL